MWALNRHLTAFALTVLAMTGCGGPPPVAIAESVVQGGFGEAAYFGAYDAAVRIGSTDRLVAVAQL